MEKWHTEKLKNSEGVVSNANIDLREMPDKFKVAMLKPPKNYKLEFLDNSAEILFKSRIDAGNCPICDKYILDGETDFKVVTDKQYGRVWVCGHHKGV